MRIYISLPITGQPIDKVREKADRVKGRISRAGHVPVNPFEIYAGKDPGYFDYLCYDLRALADCDAIYLCKNWQKSKGCRVERHFAETYDKILLFETLGQI